MPRFRFVRPASYFLLFAVTALISFAAFPVASAHAGGPKRLLIVTVTKGFRHGDSIPVAEGVISALGISGGWETDFARTDEDIAQKMTAEGLKAYDGVVFANTTGDLPLPDRDAFLKWLRSGKAFIGMHSASDTFHGWPEYLDLLGGEFKTHGAHVEVTCINDDPKHPANRRMGATPNVFDEIYQFQRFDRARFHSLLRLNQHPNDKTPGDYPIAWCRREGNGRVFLYGIGASARSVAKRMVPASRSGRHSVGVGTRKGRR